MTATASPAPREAAQPTPLQRLYQRQLAHYPDNGPRTVYLGITVLATIVLYYQLYVQGAVATKIIAEYDMTFTYFVMVSVIGNFIGAFASLVAGLADRWGRANLVVGGLLVTSLLILFGLPNAPSASAYLVLFALVSFVEGIVLVATPALIRDFSPQVGRGAAMGFWTLGPVLGSLVVTMVATNTLEAHPDWEFQFYVCGIASIVVWLITLVGLRELSPQLRDQLMVSLHDRALIEARAAGIDPEKALTGHWRQMLKLDIIGSAFAISTFLLLYYILVGFTVVYYATVFGYTEARANALANWYWITNAIALLVTGVLSDKVRVRKPFMIVGALASIIGTIMFALAATKPETSYYTFVGYFILIAAGGGVAYCAWMASFTETVEKHNPAATATGLAVWGWIIRLVVTVSLIALTFVVPATTKLVDQGPRVQEIADRYPEQVATLGAIDPATLNVLAQNPAAPDPAALASAQQQLVDSGLATDNAAALQRLIQLTTEPIPPDDLAYLQANGEDVVEAQEENPEQWQTWWWICVAGQILFLPFVFIMAGRWSPRQAREDELEHERLVERELQALAASGAPVGAGGQPGTAGGHGGHGGHGQA